MTWGLTMKRKDTQNDPQNELFLVVRTFYRYNALLIVCSMNDEKSIHIVFLSKGHPETNAGWSFGTASM